MELLISIERNKVGEGRKGELTISNSGQGRWPCKGVTFEPR